MKAISEIKRKIKTAINNHTEVYIEIHGRENLLAEGYCRIEDYGETSMVLTSNNGSVRVSGENLRLRHLANGRIAIEGRISSVEYL